MKKYILLTVVLFISSFSLFCADTEDVGAYDKEKLSLKVAKSFDERFNDPVKNFFFFKGDEQITEQEFEWIVKDDLIRENKRRLKSASDVGFGSAVALGGMAVAFFIPSVVFVVTQTTYSQNSTLYKNYDSWIDYYLTNYDYVILPGVISIGLTFVFLVAVAIDVAVTFALINKYKYNETLYRDVIERYNRKLKQKYSVMPDISMSHSSNDGDALALSLSIRL